MPFDNSEHLAPEAVLHTRSVRVPANCLKRVDLQNVAYKLLLQLANTLAPRDHHATNVAAADLFAFTSNALGDTLDVCVCQRFVDAEDLNVRLREGPGLVETDKFDSPSIQYTVWLCAEHLTLISQRADRISDAHG